MIVTVSTHACSHELSQRITKIFQSENKVSLEHVIADVLMRNNLGDEPEHERATDKNVEAIVTKHRQRAAVGLKKYGVTTERTDLTISQWLQHAQDEAMDLAIYLQRLIGEQEPTTYKGPAFQPYHPATARPADSENPLQVWADRKRGVTERDLVNGLAGDRDSFANFKPERPLPWAERMEAMHAIKLLMEASAPYLRRAPHTPRHTCNRLNQVHAAVRHFLKESEWDEALANPACVSDDGPEDSFDLLCG
jgi:hypothetical protein